jgi:hypothetical protein
VITAKQIVKVIEQVEIDMNKVFPHGDYNIPFKADIALAIIDKIKAEEDYKPCDNSGFRRSTPRIKKGKKELAKIKAEEDNVEYNKLLNKLERENRELKENYRKDK